MFHAEVKLKDRNNQWIVLIHGFGGSSKTWNKLEEYSQNYNLLLLDMHKKGNDLPKQKLTVESVCVNIAQTMDYYEIKKAHFVSISIGTMVTLAFSAFYSERVISMVLAGGILKLNLRTNFLVFIARTLKNVIPYMYLYHFFALIVLPKNNHKKSRMFFVREAEKIGAHEFIRWVDFIPLIANNEAYIKKLNSLEKAIPILYVLGSEDHLFLPETKRLYGKINNASLIIIPDCGHVCTLEKSKEFLAISQSFFQSLVKL